MALKSTGKPHYNNQKTHLICGNRSNDISSAPFDAHSSFLCEASRIRFQMSMRLTKHIKQGFQRQSDVKSGNMVSCLAQLFRVVRRKLYQQMCSRPSLYVQSHKSMHYIKQMQRRPNGIWVSLRVLTEIHKNYTRSSGLRGFHSNKNI